MVSHGQLAQEISGYFKIFQILNFYIKITNKITKFGAGKRGEVSKGLVDIILEKQDAVF